MSDPVDIIEAVAQTLYQVRHSHELWNTTDLEDCREIARLAVNALNEAESHPSP